jgi:hypothetical protein
MIVLCDQSGAINGWENRRNPVMLEQIAERKIPAFHP